MRPLVCDSKDGAGEEAGQVAEEAGIRPEDEWRTGLRQKHPGLNG